MFNIVVKFGQCDTLITTGRFTNDNNEERAFVGIHDRSFKDVTKVDVKNMPLVLEFPNADSIDKLISILQDLKEEAFNVIK